MNNEQSNLRDIWGGMLLRVPLIGLVAFCLRVGPLYAEEAALIAPPEAPASDWYSLHIQSTYATQGHGRFHSQVANGTNSMLAQSQMAETLDATLFAGVRLGDLELYFNPEMDQGFGPSNTVGVAGYVSGEAYKVGQYAPYYRTPRLFGRYVIGLGGESQSIDDGPNQLAGARDANNVTLTFGKFGIPDIFDANTYAHDPRADFLNWSVIESGAFDYAAEAWGYTYGAAAEWNEDWWTLRAGFFDVSRRPNAKYLTRGFGNNQSIVEAEERHELWDQPGKVKILAFVMNAKMGAYNDAVNWGLANGQAADMSQVRRYKLRPGVGVNMEQQIAPDLGAFLKASMNDGQYEAFDFTDINQSVTAGLSLKGARWGRADDTVGIAGVVNGISSAAQRYFAAGGLGVLAGDGVLPSYGAEKILEAYYKMVFVQGVALTLDYQHVANPAYDAVRGPIDFWAFRMHAEY